jgi:SAM-dependent methyltransferase
MTRSTVAIALLATTLCSAALAQTSTEYGDDVYRPRLGQTGKDVIWIPTPDSLVTRMLTAAKVTKDDLVYDLGAGDGKIPIAAARDFGAKAVGIEYNADMAELARRNAKRANVMARSRSSPATSSWRIFRRHTVVTMYLLPELNLRLRPIILKMKPGTRVVSARVPHGRLGAGRAVRGVRARRVPVVRARPTSRACGRSRRTAAA